MKISSSTEDLIRYLCEVGYLEICTDVGTCIGEINWKTNIKQPTRVNSSLKALRCNGLIYVSDVFYYGIRWTKIELNHKGRVYSKSLGASNG